MLQNCTFPNLGDRKFKLNLAVSDQQAVTWRLNSIQDQST